ncbi:phage antirepressor KilAC domain-containing protein [Cupriavidus metallidurans]
MNMLLNQGPAAPTMSSRDIAELVDSRHDKVMQSIERLAERGVITLPPMGEVSNPGPGPKTIKEYRIGKRDSYVIVAQLSPEFTARLVDRWQELEARAGVTVPTTLAGALRLAAEQAEAIEKQALALAAAAPKVEFVDRYVDTSGSKGFREVCKLLRANENDFRLFLLDKGIMYRLGGRLVPYAPHMDAGRFEIKAGVSGANEHAYNQTRFTPKGINWVAGLWFEQQAVAA